MSKSTLRFHAPLLLILLLHLLLSGTFSALTPLGEAPDEPAHFAYVQFLARHGRPPLDLEERREAGYKSVWPPLFQSLVAVPVAIVGETPPTRLKAVGDTPRRLIPTNGQTIASHLHTEDEAWPWRGVTLAWHLGRLVSVLLSTASIAVTYAIVWKLTRRRMLALIAAAAQTFLPQYLFIGSVVSDDTMLILLSGLIFLTMVTYTQRETIPGFGRFMLIGALLGLIAVVKYNAIPPWAIVFTWLLWLVFIDKKAAALGPSLLALLRALAGIAAGAMITAGWWFIFAWLHFNRVAELGLIRGSLASLSAGTSDAAVQNLESGAGLTLPPLAAWQTWVSMMFKSLWGTFGGGTSIEFAAWVYWLLLALALAALLGLFWPAPAAPKPARHAYLFLLLPLFFLPLTLLRFLLTGNLTETAQGRHLYPALPALMFGLVWGLARLGRLLRRGEWPLAALLMLPLLTLAAPILIRASYPPLLPLPTLSADAAPGPELAPGVRLLDYRVGAAIGGALPVELRWLATQIPPEDYLIDLIVTGGDGREVGAWLGHPVGGRYPTRAWDEGDILRDTIAVPLLPAAAAPATVTLRLLDAAGQPTGEINLGPAHIAPPSEPSPRLPGQLRADGLAPDAPFTYRNTLTFVLPGQTVTPTLTGPAGQPIEPDLFLPGGLAHFIVAAPWPSGDYQINSQFPIPNSQFTISNRPRQFTPPPVQYPLNANFADRVTLLGYDLPQRRVQPGQSFPLTLHLQARRTMGEGLAIFNHLLDAGAVQRGGADRIPLNYYTTLLWVPGEIVSDAYWVPVDEAAPPGVYWLDVGLYPTQKPELSLPLVVDGQVIAKNSVAVGPLKIGGPPPGVTVAEANPATPQRVSFGGQITLLGFTRTADQLTLYWQAETAPRADYTVFVHLLDAAGQVVAQADAPPAAGRYPTSLWDSDELIIHERTLPAGPSGPHPLAIGLYRPDTGERLPAAGFVDGVVPLGSMEQQ